MAKRNNIIIYVNEVNNQGALIESNDEVLLFQNDSVFKIDDECFRSFKNQYTKVYEGYACLGFIKLSFGGSEAHFLILVTNSLSVGKILENDIYKISSVIFIPINTNVAYEEEYSGISEIKKFLSSGCFYFTDSTNSTFDLTLTAQSCYEKKRSDDRFFWNKTLYNYLSQNGISNTGKWFTPIICGSVEIKTCYAGHQKAKLCLISRYGNERAGTRFNVRGVDDNGFVANFVETEQIIYLDEIMVCSYVQIRGSVPLFWEQTGLQVGAHKIQLSRGFQASCPAYDRHFNLLRGFYGNTIILNLLGNKEGERSLSEAYQAHHKVSTFHDSVPMVMFDYHAMCRSNKNSAQNILSLWDESLWPPLAAKGRADDSISTLKSAPGLFFVTDLSSGKLSTSKQHAGVIRTNCVDCIDRTNASQTFIGRQVLPFQMMALGINEKQLVTRFEEAFRTMWILNGDRLSNIYAGTGAMECKGKLREGALSVSRTIQSNFLDDSRQLAIDLILGAGTSPPYLPYVVPILPIGANWLSPDLTETLYYWHREFSDATPLRIFVGTWNVNGGKVLSTSDAENLTDWLTSPLYKVPKKVSNASTGDGRLPAIVDDTLPEIYIVGFQEIIDLNAKNIAMANSENQRHWESEIHKILKLKGRYVPVVSAQLVGVCVFLFAHEPILHLLSDVHLCKVKTGLGGATGNKGAVALRFTYGITTYCFICAHLAAGQSQVRERNADYAEITKSIIFPTSASGGTLPCHDYLFWFGDFNYRVDMPIDAVKDYVRQKRWPELWGAEQLSQQRHHGQAFQGFTEGPLTFAPTYKYDMFSDHYDTSDKSRVPAWTDRILWKLQPRPGFESSTELAASEVESACRLLIYQRAELKSSDHRPVYAIFDTEARIINNTTFADKLNAIIEAAGPLDKSVVVSLEVPDSETNDSTLDPQEIHKSLEIFLTQNAGEITWLRFNQEWLIPPSCQPGHHIYEHSLIASFRRGYQAFYALKLDGSLLDNHPHTRVLVRPHDPHWVRHSLSSLAQCCHVSHLPTPNDKDGSHGYNINSPYGDHDDSPSFPTNSISKVDSFVDRHPELADPIDEDIGLDLAPDVSALTISNGNRAYTSSQIEPKQHTTRLRNELLVKAAPVDPLQSYSRDGSSDHQPFPTMKNTGVPTFKSSLPPSRPPPPKLSKPLVKHEDSLLSFDDDTSNHHDYPSSHQPSGALDQDPLSIIPRDFYLTSTAGNSTFHAPQNTHDDDRSPPAHSDHRHWNPSDVGNLGDLWQPNDNDFHGNTAFETSSWYTAPSPDPTADGGGSGDGATIPASSHNPCPAHRIVDREQPSTFYLPPLPPRRNKMGPPNI